MKKLIGMLKRQEGVSKWAYEDHLGYITVGVGRCLDPEKGLGLSDDEIDYLLVNDVVRCYNELDVFSWFHDLDEVRQHAIVSMLFQLGLPKFLEFKKTLAFLAEGKVSQAAEEMLNSKWARQTPNRAREISYMIETGQYVH
jgi:lysozyme